MFSLGLCAHIRMRSETFRIHVAWGVGVNPGWAIDTFAQMPRCGGAHVRIGIVAQLSWAPREGLLGGRL